MPVEVTRIVVIWSLECGFGSLCILSILGLSWVAVIMARMFVFFF